MFEAAQLRNQSLPAGGWAGKHEVLAFQSSRLDSFLLRGIKLHYSAFNDEFFELLWDLEFCDFQAYFANKVFFYGCVYEFVRVNSVFSWLDLFALDDASVKVEKLVFACLWVVCWSSGAPGWREMKTLWLLLIEIARALSAFAAFGYGHENSLIVFEFPLLSSIFLRIPYCK